MAGSNSAGISAIECQYIVILLWFTSIKLLTRHGFNKYLPFINKWTAFIVLTSSFPTAESMPINGERCLQCNDFNRGIKDQCVRSYKECGSCLPGFVEDDLDPRICAQIELIESPSSVTREIGSDIHLPCRFLVKVDCFWTKNGHRVEIGGRSRYQYTDTAANEGDRRGDCSLDIRNASYHDTGQWACGSLANSEIDSFQSKPIHILIKERMMITDHHKPRQDLSISSNEDTAVTTTATEHGHPTTERLDHILLGPTNLNVTYFSALKPISVITIFLSIVLLFLIICLTTTLIKCGLPNFKKHKSVNYTDTV